MLFIHSRATKPLLRWNALECLCVNPNGHNWRFTPSSSSARVLTLIHQKSYAPNQWTRTSHNKAFKDNSTFGKYNVTYPKQHKIHIRERQEDKLSEEWELIFTSAVHGRYFKVIHWTLLVGLTMSIPFFVLEYFQREGEEDVMVLYQRVPAQMDILILGSIFFAVHAFLLHILCRFPRNIYRNTSKNCFKIVLRSLLPNRSIYFDFLPKEIKYVPPRFLDLMSESYTLSSLKRTLILPPHYFRTGADRASLLWASGKHV